MPQQHFRLTRHVSYVARPPSEATHSGKAPAAPQPARCLPSLNAPGWRCRRFSALCRLASWLRWTRWTRCPRSTPPRWCAARRASAAARHRHTCADAARSAAAQARNALEVVARAAPRVAPAQVFQARARPSRAAAARLAALGANPLTLRAASRRRCSTRTPLRGRAPRRWKAPASRWSTCTGALRLALALLRTRLAEAASSCRAATAAQATGAALGDALTPFLAPGAAQRRSPCCVGAACADASSALAQATRHMRPSAMRGRRAPRRWG